MKITFISYLCSWKRERKGNKAKHKFFSFFFFSVRLKDSRQKLKKKSFISFYHFFFWCLIITHKNTVQTNGILQLVDCTQYSSNSNESTILYIFLLMIVYFLLYSPVLKLKVKLKKLSLSVWTAKKKKRKGEKERTGKVLFFFYFNCSTILLFRCRQQQYISLSKYKQLNIISEFG